MIICGIDPGYRETGICWVDTRREAGSDVIDHAVIRRGFDGIPADDLKAYRLAIAGALVAGGSAALYGVEQIKPPNPHVRRKAINMTYPLITSRVIGWLDVILQGQHVIEVEPGGHGQGVLAAYPKVLFGSRTTSGTSDVLRHARSAYDVAHAALGMIAAAK